MLPLYIAHDIFDHKCEKCATYSACKAFIISSYNGCQTRIGFQMFLLTKITQTFEVYHGDASGN